MMKRNLWSLLCVVSLLFMGVAVTENHTAEDKADFQTGECRCIESACPGQTGSFEVTCRYAEQTFVCSCPAENYVFFINLDPRQKVCADGPADGDMGCECKCDGPGSSPDCMDCFSTCESIQAVAPNPDPCRGSDDNQIRCEGLAPNYPPTTCEPKIPLPQ